MSSVLLVAAALLASAATISDLDQRLAKWKAVEMPFHSAGLSAREKQMVQKLVEASTHLDAIYWLQADPEGYKLYQTTTDARLKRFLGIHGSRWDLIDENHPVAANEPMPPGRALYPKGLTREQIEQYVQQHPEDKAAIYSGYTVVKRQGERLMGVPYHEEYKQHIQPMAKALREAAALSDDAAFAAFLRLRADAFLTDDYYKSDLAWLDLEGPEDRRDLRALRDVPRRPARREDLLRRVDPDPQ